MTVPKVLVPRGSDEPLALLHFAFRAVVREPDAWLVRLGLGRVHHRILFFVGRNPGLPVGELFAILGVTKQALNAPLRALTQRKLVQSAVNPENRRQRVLTLTRRGAALEKRLSGHQRALFAAAFRRAGPTATRGFFEVMRTLAKQP
jgi:DNA-binding MarR family transcriptional regulator